jgi:extracellular factor (EF) 3-hydroxypalmitic acid methyl ester biosynthesis protein
LSVEELNLGSMTAIVEHAETGSLSGTVEDLSNHGLALTVSAGDARSIPVLSGDRLPRLVVYADGRPIHEGSAIVRRVVGREGGVLVGIELEGSGLDLSRVYRHGARRTIAERWDKAHRAARNSEITPEFKAWVASLDAYLASVETFLAREECALVAEDLATRQLLESEILDIVAPDITHEMLSATSELANIVSGFGEVEHAAHRAFCRAHLGRFFSRSPFMRRAQEKPLGYAGDYEMMNMLYREHAEGADLFGKAMNLYATAETAARANVNRIHYLVGKIEAAMQRSPGRRVRLASIGSGPGQEIQTLLTTKPGLGPFLDVALIDQESRAVAYCERALSSLAQSTGALVRVIPESVRRLLSGRALSAALGERDLVYSAGLFDYLSDRMFAALLATLYDALVPGATLAVGNVATGNPSRWAMEYFSEWFLMHRSARELVALSEGLTPPPTSVCVQSEPLGVNLFLVVER